MRDITKKFGENAGKIWSVLNEQGCIHKDKVLEVTKMQEKDFHSGVGWLAREDKINAEDNCFKLGNTNLSDDIGTKAGRVWKILDIWGEADYITIKRLSGLDDNQINTALGWLAREDKLIVDKNQKFKLK